MDGWMDGWMDGKKGGAIAINILYNNDVLSSAFIHCATLSNAKAQPRTNRRPRMDWRG